MYNDGFNSTLNKCEKKIVKAQMKDHNSYMNSVNLSPKNAFKSRYYDKGKIKFLLEYGGELKESKNFEKEDFVDEIDEMVRKQKKKHGNIHFKAITTKPVVA